MEGYEVITSDGAKLGQVVGTRGDNLIVEHGTLFKSRHALPLAFVHTDEGAQTVTTTLSKELIEDSPKVKDDEFDEAGIAAYYGLPSTVATHGSEGYGVLNDDDPSMTADQQASRQGLMPAEQERAAIRNNLGAGTTYGPPGRQIIPPDPHTSARPGDER